MTITVPARYDLAGLHRLALGIEAIDVLSGLRAAVPLQAFRGHAPTVVFPIDRHDSGALVVRMEEPGVKSRLDVLFDDPERRMVPRRITIPFVAPTDALETSVAQRSRRVTLFPGAAYPISDTATGVRGRVEESDGTPVRWTRVIAHKTGSDPQAPGGEASVLGRAHGDDRGEFLLILDSRAAALRPADSVATTIDLELSIFAAPRPSNPPDDPLESLPIEQAADAPAGAGDPPPDDRVADGRAIPGSYSRKITPAVTFTLGQIISKASPPFTL